MTDVPVHCNKCTHHYECVDGIDLCRAHTRFNPITGRQAHRPCFAVNVFGNCPDFDAKPVVAPWWVRLAAWVFDGRGVRPGYGGYNPPPAEVIESYEARQARRTIDHLPCDVCGEFLNPPDETDPIMCNPCRLACGLPPVPSRLDRAPTQTPCSSSNKSVQA